MDMNHWTGVAGGAVGGITVKVCALWAFNKYKAAKVDREFRALISAPVIQLGDYEVNSSDVPPGLELLYGLPVVDLAPTPASAASFYAVEKSSDKDKCVIDGIGDFAFSPPPATPTLPLHHLVYAIDVTPDVCTVDRFGDLELLPAASSATALWSQMLSYLLSVSAGIVGVPVACLVFLGDNTVILANILWLLAFCIVGHLISRIIQVLVDLRSELDRLRANEMGHQLKQSELEDALAGLAAVVTTEEKARRKFERKCAQFKKTLDEQETTVETDSLEEDLEQVRRELETARQAIAGHSDKLSSLSPTPDLSSDLEQVRRELGEIRQSIAGHSDELSILSPTPDLSSDLEQVRRELGDVHQTIAGHSDSLSSLSPTPDLLEEVRRELGEIRQAIAGHSDELSSLTPTPDLTADLEVVNKAISTLQADLSSLSSLSSLPDQFSDLTATLLARRTAFVAKLKPRTSVSYDSNNTFEIETRGLADDDAEGYVLAYSRAADAWLASVAKGMSHLSQQRMGRGAAPGPSFSPGPPRGPAFPPPVTSSPAAPHTPGPPTTPAFVPGYGRGTPPPPSGRGAGMGSSRWAQ